MTGSPTFLTDFAALSAIGATPRGGVDREAATIADGQARVWLTAWLQLNGFDVQIDPIGNLFGLATLVPGAPYVLLGSHLDSQPTAGRFDGAYGVLAAAHAARGVLASATSGRFAPRFNLAIVDWFNEEGSRFAPSMMGSSVFTGKLPLETALAVVDHRGVAVAEALTSIGQLGTATAPDVVAYAEIHVEQGRGLAETGVTIGIVESNWAARKFSVLITGEQAHTGATRMSDRRDALFGASLFVVALRELADEFEVGDLHTSVGRLDVRPNSPVVVPREVLLLADIRSAHATVLERADARLAEIVSEIERHSRTSITIAETHAWPVQPYQAEGVQLAERVLAQTPYSHVRTVTLAGHDSTNLKDVVPTVMLFVPSEGGIAHSELERTKDSDLLAGVDALTAVAAELASGALTSTGAAA